MKVLRAMLSMLPVVLVLILDASAHHSIGLFDRTTVTTVEGQVTRYAWLSPHIYVFVEATEADGEVVEWRFESRSIPIMLRVGWTENSLREGDRVTVEGYRLRNSDERYGWLDRVIKEDGTILLDSRSIGSPAVAPDARGNTRGVDEVQD